MSTVHVVGPATVSDPQWPSGGNTYHRMVRSGLAGLGWTTREWLVEGSAPVRERTLAGSLARSLRAIPDDEVVLLDGLVATPVPEVVCGHADRLRLVLVVHLPLGLDPHGGTVDTLDPQGDSLDTLGTLDRRRAKERSVLAAVSAVVTTSEWTKDWLLAAYAVEPGRIRTVAPGTARAALAPGSGSGRRLLCVAAVTPTKGHDVIVESLAEVADLDWTCRCIGSLDIEPQFAARVRARAESLGLGGRLTFTGPRTGEALDAEYAAADLLVVASRLETYGMVVAEALARGVPVLASAVGGIPDAVGRAPDGRRPGLLVAPADALACGAALREWLIDAALREGLRSAARARRPTLRDWSDTARGLGEVLSEVAA